MGLFRVRTARLSHQHTGLARNGVDGLFGKLRGCDDVYAAPFDTTDERRFKPDGHAPSVVGWLIGFHQQVGITAARLIINARPEQAHARVPAENLGGAALDGGDIAGIEAHLRQAMNRTVWSLTMQRKPGSEYSFENRGQSTVSKIFPGRDQSRRRNCTLTPVFEDRHTDRDFDAFGKHLALRVVNCEA